MAGIRDRWNRYTDGWFGTVIYLFLGFLIAYLFNFGLGYAFNTGTPVVAVYSCSMEHNTYSNWWYYCNSRPEDVCGKDASGINTQDFDQYWDLCGDWYMQRNITKEEFTSFPFHNGLEVGDMVLVANTGDVEVGDIIVFATSYRQVPIIHRVVQDDPLLTKGDNNGSPDNFGSVTVYGKAIFRIPLLGWVKIMFTQLTGIP